MQSGKDMQTPVSLGDRQKRGRPTRSGHEHELASEEVKMSATPIDASCASRSDLPHLLVQADRACGAEARERRTRASYDLALLTDPHGVTP